MAYYPIGAVSLPLAKGSELPRMGSSEAKVSGGHARGEVGIYVGARREPRVVCEWRSAPVGAHRSGAGPSRV
jgi:hypothetical protein